MGHSQQNRERTRSRNPALGGKYGHQMHIWDLRRRKHGKPLTWARSSRWSSNCALRMIPEHGRLCRRRRLAQGSIHRSGSGNAITAGGARRKVIEIPAEPADPDLLPDFSRGSSRSAAGHRHQSLRSTTIMLYVRAGVPAKFAGTMSANRTARNSRSVHIGGIVRRAPHPKEPVSRWRRTADGGSQPGWQRVYFTNSLYAPGTSNFIPTA